LQDFGLVSKRNGEYVLFSPIFARFVSSQKEDISTKRIAIIGGKVLKGGKEINLRPLEHKLLAYLMVEPGRVYSHDEIAWEVWDTEEVSPDMITSVIFQLRKKLGKSHIKTHHGRGYEFVDPH
jgi:DNA-binding response OmpR family regulator